MDTDDHIVVSHENRVAPETIKPKQIIHEEESTVEDLTEEDPIKEDFHRACHMSDLIRAKDLLAKGAIKYINSSDKHGDTPLMLAVYGKGVEMVAFLLDNGALIDFKSRCTITPLSLAIIAQHIDCVRVLLEHGADANTYDCCAHVLIWAVMNASVEGIQLLLANGADVTLVTPDKWESTFVYYEKKKENKEKIGKIRKIINDALNGSDNYVLK